MTKIPMSKDVSTEILATHTDQSIDHKRVLHIVAVVIQITLITKNILHMRRLRSQMNISIQIGKLTREKDPIHMPQANGTATILRAIRISQAASPFLD